MTSDPIPRDLAEGFHDAIWRYFDWTPSVPEFELSVDGQAFSMTGLCNLVDGFGDDLPEPVLARLALYMDFTANDLKTKLAADCTYRTAAYCFRELIRRRKEGYRRLEKEGYRRLEEERAQR